MTHARLDHLRRLALPEGDDAVFGDGPLLIRGLIEDAGGLDVLVRGAALFAGGS